MYSECLKPVATEQPHSGHFLQRILVQTANVKDRDALQ
jgi:hypothetical protein